MAHCKSERASFEMFGYSTDLRSLTQGRAVYSMEFEMYTQVPDKIGSGNNRESVINYF